MMVFNVCVNDTVTASIS